MGTLGGVYDIGINKDALTGREISAHSPRIMPQRFADVNARPGYVRLRGQESRTSLNKGEHPGQKADQRARQNHHKNGVRAPRSTSTARD